MMPRGVGYSFGGNTGLTAEDIKRRRDIARALIGRRGAPQNVGEGLNAIGEAIAARVNLSRANRAEKEGMSNASDLFSSLFTNAGATGSASAGPASQISLTDQDVDLLSRIAGAEAGNSAGSDGRNAVISTVLNRVASGQFPSSVSDVLNQKNQFEPVGANGASNLPVVSPERSAEARTFLSDFKDNTGGALFFANTDITDQRGTSFPSVGKEDPTAIFGQPGNSQSFFRNFDPANPSAPIGPFGVSLASNQEPLPRPPEGVLDSDPETIAPGVAPTPLPAEQITQALQGSQPLLALDSSGDDGGLTRELVNLRPGAEPSPDVQNVQSPIQRITEAFGGQQPTIPQDTPQNATQTAQASPSGVDPRLIEAIGDPFMGEGQKAVLGALLKQQLEQNRPRTPDERLETEKLGIEVDRLRNPLPKSTDDIREYEFYADQAKQAGQEPLPFDQFMQAQKRNTTVNLSPPPSGYTYIDPTDPAQGLQVIPGSPADIKQKEAAIQQQSGEESRAATTDIVVEDVDRAMAKIAANPNITTSIGGAISQSIPGTPGHDVYQLIQTIKANVGFDKLQAMRDASPTGGALGQVSEMENRLLQSVIGNLELSQTRSQLEFNLKRVKRTYQRVIHEGISDEEASGLLVGLPEDVLSGPSEDDILFTMKKHNMTREQVLEAINAH